MVPFPSLCGLQAEESALREQTLALMRENSMLTELTEVAEREQMDREALLLEMQSQALREKNADLQQIIEVIALEQEAWKSARAAETTGSVETTDRTSENSARDRAQADARALQEEVAQDKYKRETLYQLKRDNPVQGTLDLQRQDDAEAEAAGKSSDQSAAEREMSELQARMAALERERTRLLSERQAEVAQAEVRTLSDLK
jgi:hypothetical protein